MRWIVIIALISVCGTCVEAEPPKLDLAGDSLPPGAYARFGRARLRHDAKAVAFLDANTLVSFGESIRSWDVTTGKMKSELGHAQMTGSVAAAFSGDGTVLVTAHAPNHFRVWDVRDGKLIHEAVGEKLNARDQDTGMLAVSRDGKSFVTNLESLAARVWAVDPKPKATKLHDSLTVRQWAITADGSRVAATHDHARPKQGSLSIWDAKSAKLIHSEAMGPEYVCVDFSPDGNRIAVGWDGGWGVRTLEGKEVWKTEDIGEAVVVQFANDKNLIVVYETLERETQVKAALIDVDSGKVKREWSLGRETDFRCATSPDSKLFAITSRGRLRLWNMTDGQEIASSGGHSNAICSTCITPDGKFIASTDFQDKDVILWEVATGRDVRRFQGHTAGCVEVVFSPNGKWLASSSYDRTVRIWDVASTKELYKIEGFPVPVWNLRFLPDGESIAVAPQRGLTVSVYHAPTRKKLYDMAAPGNFSPSSLLRHPDGRVFVIDSTGEEGRAGKPSITVQVWDVMHSRIIQRFDGHEGRLVCSIVSPDGRTVATRADDGYIRLWELASGKMRANFHEGGMVNTTGTQFFTFSPDGRTIASANRREPRIYLWDVVTGKNFATFNAHERPMYTLEYTPDGQKLISGSQDATLLGWDMTTQDRRSRELPRESLSKDDLNKLWDTLRNGNAAEAYKAKWLFVADPEATIAFLRGKFEPAKRVEPEKIKTWLTELDSPKFPVREAAEKSLLMYFDQAEPDLLQAHEKSTGEVRKRLARILDTELSAIPSPDVLRELRAVEILDAIGTKAAFDALRELAPGKVRARIARDAAASVKRLSSGEPRP